MNENQNHGTGSREPLRVATLKKAPRRTPLIFFASPPDCGRGDQRRRSHISRGSVDGQGTRAMENVGRLGVESWPDLETWSKEGRYWAELGSSWVQLGLNIGSIEGRPSHDGRLYLPRAEADVGHLWLVERGRVRSTARGCLQAGRARGSPEG